MSSTLDAEIGGYRIERVVGRGGMSVVYLAEQRRLGRMVALKVLSPELSIDQGFRDRFTRECKLAAALEHPNIVQIYDAGESGGVLYLAMRYVEGDTLSSLLRTAGKLEPRRAISIVGQIAGALDAAHTKELIHGDVKPGNILIARTAESDTDQCFLVDFGIARRGSSLLGLTEHGHLMGTIDYMPPEVIEEGAIDARTDVYSLGCVLYECLAGSPPFPRTSDVAVAYAHLEDPPPKVTARRPGLPPAIDHVIATALAKQKDDRFATCSDLVEAAAASLGEAPVRTRSPAPEPVRPRRIRRRRLLPVAALAVVAALAASAIIVYRLLGTSPGTAWIRSQMFVMNADGSGSHRFATGAESDRGASMAPSGDRLAFGSGRDGNEEIYEINLDGTSLTNVTNNPATDGQPSWSPAGDRIAFVSDRQDGNDEIYTMSVDGSDVTRLTEDPGADSDPVWSPDGSRIAFITDRNGNVDIYAMDPSGGNVVNLTRKTSTDTSPSWSPDGERIAFVSSRDGNREIYVMDADGSNLRRLTFDPSTDHGPAWSPDGSKIAFVSNRSGSKDIYVVNLTGSAVTRLTTDPGDDFSPVWSLDGKSIFFIRSQLNVLNSPSATVGVAIMATFPK